MSAQQTDPAAISDRYEPAAVEERWYPIWEERGYFRADPTSSKKPYSPGLSGSLGVSR